MYRTLVQQLSDIIAKIDAWKSYTIISDNMQPAEKQDSTTNQCSVLKTFKSDVWPCLWYIKYWHEYKHERHHKFHYFCYFEGFGVLTTIIAAPVRCGAATSCGFALG